MGLRNRKFYLLLLIVVLNLNLSYAKRPLLVEGPRQLFKWWLWAISPLNSAVLSICLAFEGSGILATIMRLRGVSIKKCIKFFVFATFCSSLPALGYLMALYIGAYHESKTFSPFLFDFLVDYYPSAIVLGMTGAFIRGLYAFNRGWAPRKTIYISIFYLLLVSLVFLLGGYMLGLMRLFESLGDFFYATLAVVAGLFHGFYHFFQTHNLRQAISQGIGLYTLVWIAMIAAFYHEQHQFAVDNYSAWRAMLVPFCTLPICFFVFWVYLNSASPLSFKEKG